MDGARERERVLEELAGNALGVIAVRQHVDAHLAGGKARRRLHGLRDAAKARLANDDAVHHDLDVVLELLVELDLLVKLADLAVDANAREALRTQVIEELRVLTLAAEDHGGKHQRATTLTSGEDLIRHLVRRLTLDDAAALRAVGRTHAREEQTKVVIDLRHGAHGRARVLRRGLLVDGNGRGEAIDRV